MPWRKITKDYKLYDSKDGKEVSLHDLFSGGKEGLIVYHFMFDDAIEKPCAFCSMYADSFDGPLPHLRQRVNFAVIAKARPEKLRALAEQKGWKFPFYSCLDSDFDVDFGVGFTHAQVKSGKKLYNYGHAIPYGTQSQGISVFHLEDETLFHTYSTFARGIEFQNNLLTLLDLTPIGRYGEAGFEHWARHKEEYEAPSGNKRKKGSDKNERKRQKSKV